MKNTGKREVWPRKGRDSYKRLSGVCLLLLLPFVLFWQVWWPNPAQRLAFADGDFTQQHYPMRTFVAREYRQGCLPLWSPYTFSGTAVAAESTYATFYPLGLWEVVFRQLPLWSLEIEALIELGLAAVFTCLLVQRLTGRLEAGILAGLTFGLGGFLTSYPVLQLVILQAALWLPAGLWLLEGGLQHHALSEVSLAGVALGLGLLGAHFQTFLYIVYVTAAYFLFRTLTLRLPWRFAVTAAAVLGLVVLGVGASQVLPSLEIMGFSPRANLSYAEVAHGFRPAELLGLFRPNLGEWSPLYVGLIPLGLALLALAAYRKAETWFWGGVALVSLLLSLGGNGFLYPVFHAVAPGFALFRGQERAAFLVSFALAVLAGYGLAWVLERRWWRRGIFPLLLLLTFLDLYRANNGVVLQPLPEGGYAAPTAALTYLQSLDEPLARISSEARLPTGGNEGLIFGLRDVTGNGPLYQAKYDLFLNIVPEVRWWQLLNVRYVVTQRHIDYPGITLVLDDPVRDERVYRLDLGGQPLWITHEAEIMPDQEAAIWYTSDMGLVEPLQTAVLEQAPVPAPQPATGPETARITRFEPQRVVGQVTLSAPAVVVFSEIAYPGWVARVNGKRVPALRAFGMLRAVALPAGEWEIEWRFRPLTVYGGLALNGITLLSVVSLLLRRRRRDVEVV